MIRIRARGPAATLMLLCVAFSSSPARAADEDEGTPFRLEYTASGDACLDREAFLREILARTKRPRLVTRDDEPAIALTALIEAKGETSSTGRLDVREPDGTAEARSVTARTCPEVAKALALIAALILDPDARTEPVPPPSPSPSPSPSPPPPPPSSPSRSPFPSPPRPPPPSEPPSTNAAHAWSAHVGAQAGILGAIGPTVAPAAGLFFELDHTTARGWSSSARVTFEIARTAADLARGGTQTYEWLGGSVRACPIHFPLPANLRAAPCAALQIGAHRGSTQDVLNPTASTELWIAPEGLASLEWAFGPTFAIELSGGALFPLRRTRYFLAPNTTIFEVPAVAPTATFALRVRIL